MSPTTLPNPFDFSEQVVLVTGSAKGIGRGIAARFAAAGARVAVHFHTSAAAAASLVSQIQNQGGSAHAYRANLSHPAEVDSLFSAVQSTFGRLDVLVNNAGAYPVTSLLEITAEEWDEILNANLRSAHLCTRSAARLMIAQGSGGSIVNIATIEARSTAPGHSHYAAAKAGLLMYTRSAAIELAPHGIRVNAVSPGLIWRPGIEEQIPEFVARWKATNPSRRLGLPEEIGDACLLLASSAASWITGVDLPVDGGELAR
ncbi:MAG TPA: SDR family NAD(P)-dependent oxidoreductase [Anaerolineaceae bacterium]|nr:SDR family NAD(P)-dependent oxidoreductase [Anaerolineaceae bacterium]